MSEDKERRIHKAPVRSRFGKKVSFVLKDGSESSLCGTDNACKDSKKRMTLQKIKTEVFKLKEATVERFKSRLNLIDIGQF